MSLMNFSIFAWGRDLRNNRATAEKGCEGTLCLVLFAVTISPFKLMMQPKLSYVLAVAY